MDLAVVRIAAVPRLVLMQCAPLLRVAALEIGYRLFVINRNIGWSDALRLRHYAPTLRANGWWESVHTVRAERSLLKETSERLNRRRFSTAKDWSSNDFKLLKNKGTGFQRALE